MTEDLAQRLFSFTHINVTLLKYERLENSHKGLNYECLRFLMLSMQFLVTIWLTNIDDLFSLLKKPVNFGRQFALHYTKDFFLIMGIHW